MGSTGVTHSTTGGAAAAPATAAAALGLHAVATDVPDIVRDTEKVLEGHRAAAREARAPLKGSLAAAPLFWGAAEAEDFLGTHARADLLLGSEVVYALKATDWKVAARTMNQLAATVAALLAERGVFLLCYHPRADVEKLFFSVLGEHGLRLRADSRGPRGVPLDDLGLAFHEVDGLRLLAIEHDAADAPRPPAFRPIVVSLPPAAPLEDVLD